MEPHGQTPGLLGRGVDKTIRRIFLIYHWAHSKVALHCIRIAEARVRFSLGPHRRGARVVDWGALEKRCPTCGTGGSNPSLSALMFGKNTIMGESENFTHLSWLVYIFYKINF